VDVVLVQGVEGGVKRITCEPMVHASPESAAATAFDSRREIDLPGKAHKVHHSMIAGLSVDVLSLDNARDAWRTGAPAVVKDAAVETISLGACLEAACWATSGGAEVMALLSRWGQDVSSLRTALSALTTASPLPRPGDHDAPADEMRRCPSRRELEDSDFGVEWNYFLDRFRRSLVERLKLTSSTARALSAALAEMVDNVVDHAGLGDAPTGVVAYEVDEGRFGFAIADIGRGILASLRENPLHAGVATDSQALLAAVTRGASRRTGAAGTGFADLLRALADMEGRLVFRSGAARLILEGRSAGSRLATSFNSPELLGFQLSVEVEPRKSPW
jgi:hypothetical protein